MGRREERGPAGVSQSENEQEWLREHSQMTSRKEEGGGKATSNTRAKDMEHKNMTKGEGGQKMSKFA